MNVHWLRMMKTSLTVQPSRSRWWLMTLYLFEIWYTSKIDILYLAVLIFTPLYTIILAIWVIQYWNALYLFVSIFKVLSLVVENFAWLFALFLTSAYSLFWHIIKANLLQPRTLWWHFLSLLTGNLALRWQHRIYPWPLLMCLHDNFLMLLLLSIVRVATAKLVSILGKLSRLGAVLLVTCWLVFASRANNTLFVALILTFRNKLFWRRVDQLLITGAFFTCTHSILKKIRRVLIICSLLGWGCSKLMSWLTALISGSSNTLSHFNCIDFIRYTMKVDFKMMSILVMWLHFMGVSGIFLFFCDRMMALLLRFLFEKFFIIMKAGVVSLISWWLINVLRILANAWVVGKTAMATSKSFINAVEKLLSLVGVLMAKIACSVELVHSRLWISSTYCTNSRLLRIWKNSLFFGFLFIEQKIFEIIILLGIKSFGIH